MKRIQKLISAAFVVFALTGCSAARQARHTEVPTDPSIVWAKSITEYYYSGSELEKFTSRNTAGIAAGVVAWSEALKPKFEEFAPPMELLMVVPRYDPIWQGGELNKQAMTEHLARIPHLSKELITTWNQALAKAHRAGVSELWTIAILIDIPQLFTSTGIKTEESEKLLSRMEQIPADAVESLAKLANIGKARVVANLIQQDWLFNAGGFDREKFLHAEGVLRRSLSSDPTKIGGAQQKGFDF